MSLFPLTMGRTYRVIYKSQLVAGVFLKTETSEPITRKKYFIFGKDVVSIPGYTKYLFDIGVEEEHLNFDYTRYTTNIRKLFKLNKGAVLCEYR